MLAFLHTALSCLAAGHIKEVVRADSESAAPLYGCLRVGFKSLDEALRIVFSADDGEEQLRQ